MITKREIEKVIDDSLGLTTSDDDHERLSEAYVALPKLYDHPTELISERTKKAHADLYEGYVRALNNVSANLDSVDRSLAGSNGSAFRSLKIDESFNLNATWLHELYFANISDLSSEVTSDSLAYIRFARDFGTFDDWQRDFIACAMSSRNGWVVTGYHMFLKRYVNAVIDGHDEHVMFGLYPVVVVDMFEHAYRDYAGDRMAYVIGMMKELKWEIIEERCRRVERVAKAIEI